VHLENSVYVDVKLFAKIRGEGNFTCVAITLRIAIASTCICVKEFFFILDSRRKKAKTGGLMRTKDFVCEWNEEDCDAGSCEHN
jgi:hypothetical protein